MKARPIIFHCSFCKSVGLSRGILVRGNEFKQISALSVQKPIDQNRLIVTCRRCGVVFFAHQRKYFVKIENSESIHSDDFLSIGLRTASKDELYQKMIADFTQLLVELETKVSGLCLSDTIVADVGSGIGSLTAALAENGNRVISIEPSINDLKLQQERQRSLADRIEHYSSVRESILSKNAHHVKLVFAWQVIEHLKSPLITLKEIRKIFPNQEYLIGSVPALHPRNISQHHKILLQEHTVIKWLGLSGYEIVYIEYVHVLGFINFVARNTRSNKHPHDIKSLGRDPYRLDELLTLQLFRGSLDSNILQGCIDNLSYKLQLSQSQKDSV
jgi:2-polyprenyl-3-methyl-5-hydroxy-6-metoxy-1,4-benzoquinol methylase